jgi:hypothetical protein
VGLPGIIYVEADQLDGIGDVRVGEPQLLEGPDETRVLNQISNRRLGLGG